MEADSREIPCRTKLPSKNMPLKVISENFLHKEWLNFFVKCFKDEKKIPNIKISAKNRVLEQ